MRGEVSVVTTQIMVMAVVISVILLFVGIGVLVLIHVCIVGRAFSRGFNSDNTVEMGGININHSMSHDELEKLPCYEFTAVEKGSSPIDCVVCLENFKMGEKCRLLPICKHSFHAQCVDSWLLKRPICPICRTSAGSQRRDTVSGADESSRSGQVVLELRENETDVVGNQVNTNSSPISSSPPSENVV